MYKEERRHDNVRKIAWIYFLAWVMFTCMTAQAQTKVAIIDSGLNLFPGAKVCKTGHYDFTSNMPNIGPDIEPEHGTQVVKTIQIYAGSANYCILVYKIFASGRPGANALTVAKAVDMARMNGARIINMSLDGYGDPSIHEKNAMAEAAKTSRIFLAAGNYGKNLNKNKFYPVSYRTKNTTVVGSDSSVSNYGSIVTQIEAHCQDKFCGTSASTAIATGKFIGGKR